MLAPRRFFNEEEKALIVNAIREAELHTSGEIRVHVERFCFGDPVRRAGRVFTQLRMQQTEARNGILIYLAVFHKKIAVIGDQGIHQRLGDVFWKELVDSIIQQFRDGKKGEGLAAGIITCGKQLSLYFPRQANDVNELSDDISY